MRKVLVIIALAGAMALAATATAAAYSCHSWKCVNKALNSMHSQLSSTQAQLNKDTKALSSLSSCLGELPITDYGDPSGTFGYVYDGGGGSDFDTTALDVTASTDTVDYWLLGDACNTSTSPSIAHSITQARAGLGAIAPELSIRRAQGK